MYRILGWIERTNWRTVLTMGFMCSCTLSLVFAGTLNDSVDQSSVVNIPSEQAVESLRGKSSHSTTVRRSQHPVREVSPASSTSLAPHLPATSGMDEEISLLLDLSQNLLLVMKGERVIHTALAATGSGKVLHDPKNPSRTWTFKTPKGSFTIQNKLKNPVWIRPDWAFIEKGVPVPTTSEHRLLPNVLGDYALGFGNGYFIHGALYTYLLGFNVTHGCIQLDDDDLEYIFETVPVGATLVIV
ncbi:MAG: hypothetical protein NPIRA05_12620 [Nitrospirales bacterium]|nr:MAG: hypothetical protein NPIRA05_12620 [Nitrospirales bacterium]